MLLGIGLHSSLSFFPAYWVVQDSQLQPDSFYGFFFSAVHGFRMPLFFVLSGFFTTMLWRRRGLGALVRQRATRIALPLAIGTLTVVPVMNWVVDQSAPEPDIAAAVVAGNPNDVQRFLDDGYELEARGDDGGTILLLAAVFGNVEVVEVLLEAGADANTMNNYGETPLGIAFAFGHETVADLLVDYGVPDERPPGVGWTDIEGWGFLAESLDLAEAPEGPESWIESFHHLWFLWFLCLLVAGFVVVARVSELAIRALDRDHLISHRSTLLLLGCLIAATWPVQYLMGRQGDNRVFGPDTSTGLIPDGHVLGYYALFFGFGALMYGAQGRNGTMLAENAGRFSMYLLPASLSALLPVGLLATYGDDQNAPWSWAYATLLQAAYTWLMIFGLMGLFRMLLGVERRGVRYLSDAAYWLYIAHLPLIIAGQAWIRDWDTPASVKFLGLCTVSTLILLLSYQLGVRYTPIGWILNGRRRSRLRACVGFRRPRWRARRDCGYRSCSSGDR